MEQGYCYVSKSGNFHVVEQQETAIQYTRNETIAVYDFPYEGGYPLDEEGNQLIIYVNEDNRERFNRAIPSYVLEAIDQVK